MLKVISDQIWGELRKLAKTSTSKWAAVAYVSSDSVVRFDEGDLLVVDASDAAIQTGQTSARVLRAAYNRGAELVSLSGLHAKTLVFNETVLVGSANLSENSARLHESGIISDDPRIVSGAVQLIRLFAKAGKEIDDAFLSRVEQLPVSKRRFVPVSGVRPEKIALKENRAWIVGIPGDVSYPGDESVVDEVQDAVSVTAPTGAGVDWFWWRGRSRFSRFAKEGDTFISLYREHREARSTRSVRVYPPTSIRMVF